jgi:hypothetical protein
MDQAVEAAPAGTGRSVENGRGTAITSGRCSRIVGPGPPRCVMASGALGRRRRRK